MLHKRLLSLIVITIVGTVLVPLIGGYFLSDKRISWVSLGAPPEPPVRFINTYQGFLVEDASGLLYENCGENCWNSEQVDQHVEVEDIKCPKREPPSNPELALKTSFCTPWGPGMIYSSYGVSDDGSVYMWETRTGEWDSLVNLLLPVVGGLVFLFIGLFVVLIKSFNNYLQRISEKESDQRN